MPMFIAVLAHCISPVTIRGLGNEICEQMTTIFHKRLSLYRDIFKAINEFMGQHFTATCASPATMCTGILPVTQHA
jgi:hypothetical protein